MKYIYFLAIGFILFAFKAEIVNQNVYQFRGENRQGNYNGIPIMKSWPEEGPELLWSYDSMGSGYSSVISVDGVLYTTYRKDTMDYIIALNEDGSLIYERPYGEAWRKSFPDTRCTPTYDEGKLYLTSGNGIVCCVDAKTGTDIWSINGLVKFSGKTGMWGVAESVLIVGDKAIYTPCGDKTTVVALDKNTGETVWQSECMNDESGYVSPISVDWKGQKQIIAVSKLYIMSLNPEDGSTLWKYDYSVHADTLSKRPGITTNSPLYQDGMLYITCGYNHASVMLKIADDSKSVDHVWTNAILDNHMGGVVLSNGYIYGSNWESNSMGSWICLDWQTGELKYESKWENKGPIISADNMLICYNEKPGAIGLVKATPDSFNLVSSFNVPNGSGQHWAHPVLCNGILYVRHGNSLMAYDIREK